MSFIFGTHSKRELEGVKRDLVRVTRRALALTEQDFTVHDGIRAVEEQREYVARGVSQTMDSLHLPQDDGQGHAVDLVPYINGKIRWELEACYMIAVAMRAAAKEFGVPILWGGCWQRLDLSTVTPATMVEEYVTKRRRQGRRPFIDAPHYQLI